MAEKDDDRQIFVDLFSKVIKQFKLKCSSNDWDTLIKTYPGRAEGHRKRINIEVLYDVFDDHARLEMYKAVKIGENE